MQSDLSDYVTSDSGICSSTGQLSMINPRRALKPKLSLDLTDSESSAVWADRTPPAASVKKVQVPRETNSEADVPPPRPVAPKPTRFTKSFELKPSQRKGSEQDVLETLSEAKRRLYEVYNEENKKPINYMVFEPGTDGIPVPVETKEEPAADPDALTDEPKNSSSTTSSDTSAITVIEVVRHTQVGQRISGKSLDSADTLYEATDTSVNGDAGEQKSKEKMDQCDGNSKVVKDFKNKLCKISESPPQRLSKTLAAEISDFFKASASKLKPPCLDITKRDAKKKIQRDISEPTLKPTQRLIPRSPYTASPKKSPTVKPPFYAWNLNSKNAAVCIPSSASCPSICKDIDQKTMKTIENTTRKMLIQNGSKRPEQTTSKTPKPPPVPKTKPRLMLKIDQEDRSLKRKHSPASLSLNLKDLKIASKTIPKIHIQLPTPKITLTKVKTQLPCELPTDKVKVKQTATDKVKKEVEKVEKIEHPKPKLKKSASFPNFLDLVKSKREQEIEVESVSDKHKSFNTWPQRKRGESPQREDSELPQTKQVSDKQKPTAD